MMIGVAEYIVLPTLDLYIYITYNITYTHIFFFKKRLFKIYKYM